MVDFLHTKRYGFILLIMDTRMRILERVYEDMRVKGFQGLRADVVMKSMDVTKGALYYHFKNKTVLGYAILEEVIQPEYLKPYLPLLEYEGNPVSFLQSILSGIKLTTEAKDLMLGDPVHNLALEMSPLDEGFRKRLEIMQDSVKDIISDALYRGQVRGFVVDRAKPVQIASFFQAMLAGNYGMAKAHLNKRAFDSNLDMLAEYLDEFRVGV